MKKNDRLPVSTGGGEDAILLEFWGKFLYLYFKVCTLFEHVLSGGAETMIIC
jgi:hypothetical protein